MTNGTVGACDRLERQKNRREAGVGEVAMDKRASCPRYELVKRPRFNSCTPCFLWTFPYGFGGALTDVSVQLQQTG